MNKLLQLALALTGWGFLLIAGCITGFILHYTSTGLLLLVIALILNLTGFVGSIFWKENNG